jgi:hypothetical protein
MQGFYAHPSAKMHPASGTESQREIDRPGKGVKIHNRKYVLGIDAYTNIRIIG